MTEKRKSEGKQIDTTIEIAAPADAVWKALTDAQDLARWFPLSAHVTPGAGGEIRMSWGPPWEGSSRIEIWEPDRRLRTRGFLETGGAVIEYTLETRGGKTLLRLVQSGFEPKTDWDDEHFEGTRRGWRFELRCLRHYLERHRGAPRAVAWPRVSNSLPAEEVWRRVLGREGLAREGSAEGLREGNAYRLTACTGELFEGTVQVNDPPYEFAGTVKNLDDALLTARMYEIGGPTPDAGHQACLFLATWGRSQSEADAFRDRWQRELGRLLGG